MKAAALGPSCLVLLGLLTACAGSIATGLVDDDEEIGSTDLAEAEAALQRALDAEQISTSQLRVAYSRYLSVAPDGPARSRRAIEYAELLLAGGQLEEAASQLAAAVAMDALEPERRAHAARLLVDARVAIWKSSTTSEGRIEAATRIRELFAELQADADQWLLDNPDATALRRRFAPLAVELSWDLALSSKQLGLEHDRREAFLRCKDELLELYNSFGDFIEPAPVLAEAADCSTRAFEIGDAMQMRQALITDYPDSSQARDALFALAETYQSVLFFREARDAYADFSARYPEDERVTLARARWLQLALTLDDSVAEIVATSASWQDTALDQGSLEAAVEFRAIEQGGELEALDAYLARHRGPGGPAREVAVRVALANEAMRRSCSDRSRATGLCTRQTVDGRLGEVLRRDRRAQREAERQLKRAGQIMAEAGWREDPVAMAGPPLALEPEELLELEATVALLVGDLSAEAALGVQPPRTYEPSRTRLWLEERERSVAEMVAAYERVGVNDAARAAAAAERRAQVYESDATLLARVGGELREREDPKLARELEQLEAERLSQALAAYQQCLTAIAEYGDDPTGVRRACRRGVGRLAGGYEAEVPAPAGSSLGALVLGAD